VYIFRHMLPSLNVKEADGCC